MEKRNIIIFILSFIILATTGIIFVFMKGAPAPFVVEPQPPPTEIPADWKTYRNEEYGFEISQTPPTKSVAWWVGSPQRRSIYPFITCWLIVRMILAHFLLVLWCISWFAQVQILRWRLRILLPRNARQWSFVLSQRIVGQWQWQWRSSPSWIRWYYSLHVLEELKCTCGCGQALLFLQWFYILFDLQAHGRLVPDVFVSCRIMPFACAWGQIPRGTCAPFWMS